ncbi:MAG: hypothetical protein ILA19_05305, partial [Bacilli bacterium]|nr:hypothetical protein [Bacilli bacterium]
NMNKKFLISIIIVIILGILSAKSVYSLSDDINKKNMYYFLQLGVYENLDNLNEDTKNIDDKIVLKENNNFYVYVGISKDKNNLKKLSNMYKNLGYNLLIKTKAIVSEEFIANLEQFDKLLKQTNDLEELKKIMAVILSSYQEMVINSII